MKRIFLLGLVALLSANMVCARSMQLVDGRTFVLSYDADKWDVEALDAQVDIVKDSYAFFFEAFNEYGAYAYYFTDYSAEKFNQERVRGKEDIFNDVTSMGATEKVTMWGEQMYMTTFKKPFSGELYDGIVLVGNVNNGLVFIYVISANIKKSEFMDLMKSMVLKQYEPEPVIEVLDPVSIVEEKQEPVAETAVPAADDETIYATVENLPEFPGGQQALFKYLKDNIMYPTIAKENGIQGRVVCTFVVEKDGRITNVEVVRSGGDPSLDKEAVRVIKYMPKWKPGKQQGVTVRVQYTVPVSFRL